MKYKRAIQSHIIVEITKEMLKMNDDLMEKCRLLGVKETAAENLIKHIEESCDYSTLGYKVIMQNVVYLVWDKRQPLFVAHAYLNNIIRVGHEQIEEVRRSGIAKDCCEFESGDQKEQQSDSKEQKDRKVFRGTVKAISAIRKRVRMVLEKIRRF